MQYSLSLSHVPLSTENKVKQEIRSSLSPAAFWYYLFWSVANAFVRQTIPTGILFVRFGNACSQPSYF